MFKQILRFSALIVILAACNAAPAAPPTSTPAPGGSAAGLQVLMVQSVLTVGPNRFAFVLLNGDVFVKNAKLTLTFYDLGKGEKPVGTLPGVYREAPDGLVGMYTAEMTFAEAGSWGVAVAGTASDGKVIDQKVAFEVVASSPELAVGKKAPAAKSPTLDSVGGDYKKLTSAPKPNPAFYRFSVDQALASGKPTLVQFSTPAFCNSRLCGPAYDVIDKMYPAYADKVNFVHVEVYKDLPNPDLSKPQIADAMTAWGLKTDPWTYLLDKDGVVVWRVEGLVTTDEVQAALDKLLKAS